MVRSIVPFASEDLDRIARLENGTLDEIPFAVLLYAMARAKRNTSLEIRRGQLQKEVFFEDGVPVDCRSNLVHETLSRFIVSTGRLDEATANACFNESVARSLRFGDILIEKELVGAEELIKILQQNLAHKLLDGFSWHDGSFRVIGRSFQVDSPLKVNVPQLIFIGVSRFATQEQIDGSIGPLIGTPLALHPSPVFSAEDVKLPAAHMPVQDALRKRPMRIDELASQTGISYEDLTRTLYALTLIEMVVPADQLPSEKTRPPARPPQRKAQAAPLPAEPKISDEVREELMELALNHRRKDAFAILGVDPDHADATAHHRFLRFAEKFAPWQFDEELADQAREVFLAGARAYAEVCDPDRRALLVKEKTPKSPGAEGKASKPTPKAPMAESRIPARRPEGGDQFRIKTDLLDSEAQFKKGMELLESGRHDLALEQLEFAAELDPQNLRYSSEAAYCRFLTDPVSNAKPALEKLREAIRVDPQFGLALFYSGEILREAGKFAEAESFLKRSLKPMAPDRRPVDALRALNRDRKAAEAT